MSLEPILEPGELLASCRYRWLERTATNTETLSLSIQSPIPVDDRR